MTMQSEAPPRLAALTDTLWIPGRILFSTAIVALGVTNIVCSRMEGYHLGPGGPVIPLLPWLPAVPLLVGVVGVACASCGMGLLAGRGVLAARVLAASLAASAILTLLPRYLFAPADLALRTALFETLAIAAIAFLQQGRDAAPPELVYASRIVLGLSIAVFGLNCFLGLDEMAAQFPAWVPAAALWLPLCGGVPILAGLLLMASVQQPIVSALLGCLAALCALVLLPAALDALIVPSASFDPAACSRFLFAVGLWGGLWTLARRPVQQQRRSSIQSIESMRSIKPIESMRSIKSVKPIKRPVYAGRATGGSLRRPS